MNGHTRLAVAVCLTVLGLSCLAAGLVLLIGGYDLPENTGKVLVLIIGALLAVAGVTLGFKAVGTKGPGIPLKESETQ